MNRTDDAVTLNLPYEPPLNWAFLLDFLQQRRTAGVEAISDAAYVRTAVARGDPGLVRVENDPEEARLVVTMVGPLRRHAEAVAARVRHMFDLDMTHSELDALEDDPIIGPLRRASPGIRIPGAWSPFEALLRIVVGQQVSVSAATTIAGRIVERTGAPLPEFLTGSEPLVSRLFPEPRAVAEADLEAIGMPGRRVAALQTVARHMADGTIAIPDPADADPDEGQVESSPDEVKAVLMTLPGIGPWTAEFFALRALGDRDAWPETDLILRRQLETHARAAVAKAGGAPHGVDEDETIDPATVRTAIREMTERWRPYRAYAALHLWHAASRPPTQR